MESCDNIQTKVDIISVDFKHNKNTEYTTLAKKCINTPSVTSPMYNGSSYYSSYNSGTTENNNYDGYINCTFYEWSRIDDKHRKFDRESQLFKFLEESKIVLDEGDKYTIRHKYMLFMTCIPGENRLLISASFYGLQNMLEEAYKKKGLSVPKSFYSTLV